MLKSVTGFIKRLAGLFLGFSLALILIQELLIFPLALGSLFVSTERDPKTIPNGFEIFRLKSEDGVEIEVARLGAEKANTATISEDSKKVAIFFHGNGETIDNTFWFLRWLRSLGFTAYSYEYRGYGKSTGWPSEEGFYKDVRSVWRYVRERENVTANEVALVAGSLGTGPAAYLASEIKPRLLVLFAPYSSIPDVAAEKAFYKIYVPFLWYNFPVKNYVGTLDETSVVIAHGKRDGVIPFSSAPRIEAAYKGSGKLVAVYDDNAHHGNIFMVTKERMESEIAEVFSARK